MRSRTFTVYGSPTPQGNKTRNRYGAIYDKTKGLDDWRAAVARAAIDEGSPMLTGPVAVSLQFVLERPKGHWGTGRNLGVLKASAAPFPATRPDIDKLTRAVLDAMTQAKVYEDDGKVVRLKVTKVYAGWGKPARCDVYVREQVE